MSRSDRPTIVGEDSGPAPPYPLKLEGEVVKGFGRGSKELGIPTANIPIDGLSVAGHSDLASGIYFGWAGLSGLQRARAAPDDSTASAADALQRVASKGRADVYPMVMSVGWNPFYKNSVRSVEVHILHTFPADFYGAHLRLLIMGYVRPELDYVSKEALVDDIKTDIAVAEKSLERETWKSHASDEWLSEDV